MTIRVLSEKTIGKIAAGEVIERPASIVKELLENALDSGATKIDIEVQRGGLDSIRVIDNGCGIAAEELPLALERHATSKLLDFEDLEQVRTLGFRGEALASIAAVSHLQIRSSCDDGAGAATIASEFGGPAVLAPGAGAKGTTVEVRDLFANVPARMKFLRQPSTEASVIQRVVAAYASSRPAVAIRLEIDGRLTFATDGRGSLTDTAALVYGKDVGAAVLELPELDESARVPGVSASGWVTGPSVTRSHRQQLHFFVNGRLIQHRSLAFITEECFHTLLMVGRHPIASISIDLDPSSVDVNVHPTKAEVRFVDERSVIRAVQRAVHAALANAPAEELPRITFSIPGPSFPDPAPVQATLVDRVAAPAPAAVDEEIEAQAAPSRAVPMLRVLGQVGATYIIAEGPDGLYLIDQHAAHERVMYEKLRAQIGNRTLDVQHFLDPMVIELDAHETSVLERSLDELRQIGFEIEPFGPNTFTIRAIPAMMTGIDIRERMHHIIAELAEGGAGESWLDSVAISAACHTSIRAGQLLSIAEMRELVNQLEQTEHPRACGHGRPTMLLMSQVDLEKQFSRR
ncbi:MAG: DNA mismatch repair endonuclease MutL [Chloroflexota bacterium]|nr:DNA mismatch repair endonuclease MutL [Chloroflexota bacterium]